MRSELWMMENMGVNPGVEGVATSQILVWEGRGVSMKYYNIL